MRSIERQLSLATVAAVIALVLLGGALASWTIATRLRHDFDGALATEAKALASLAELVDGTRLDFDFSVPPGLTVVLLLI